MIETPEDLEKEWGPERYFRALADLCNWWASGVQHPVSAEQMRELRAKNPDAFKLFASRIYHLEGSNA